MVGPIGLGEGQNIKITSAIDSGVQKTTSSMTHIDKIIIRMIHEVLASGDPNKKGRGRPQRGRGRSKLKNNISNRFRGPN